MSLRHGHVPFAAALLPAAPFAAALLCACLEPSYVSLGRNAQRVERNVATGVDPCGGADDSFVPGCEPPPEPPGCELTGTSVALDSACEERRNVACRDVLSGGATALNGELSALLGSCSVRDHQLTVLFADGCASAYSLGPIDEPGAAAAEACVAARLASERYACALGLDCGFGNWFGVPTSAVPPPWY